MSGLRRILGSRRGQIVIPSLFVIPSLMLFVYLIYETAKLSREKIRHQFAVDSAAFVEMTNYADFMNRTAYVNGAFPQRIFAEGFMNGPMIPKKRNDAEKDSLYDILYWNGAFPRRGGSTEGLDPLDQIDKWQIRFDGSFGDRNNNPASVDDKLELITMQNALDYYISWEDAQDIYKLYVQIYQLLGSVLDAQYSVFKRLTQGANPHTFYRKSYWLNTGDPIGDAAEGAKYFSNHSFKPEARCVRYINIVGNKPTNDPYQPYKQVQPTNPIEMPATVSNELCSGGGLFQMAFVPQNHIDDMNRVQGGLSRWPGYAVVQHWKAPSNYFRVAFNDVCELPGGGQPCVHATIALAGGAVWPDPTPKYQTRLYP